MVKVSYRTHPKAWLMIGRFPFRRFPVTLSGNAVAAAIGRLVDILGLAGRRLRLRRRLRRIGLG